MPFLILWCFFFVEQDVFDFFGLSKFPLVYLAEQLPGGQKCRNYKFQYHLPCSVDEDKVCLSSLKVMYSFGPEWFILQTNCLGAKSAGAIVDSLLGSLRQQVVVISAISLSTIFLIYTFCLQYLSVIPFIYNIFGLQPYLFAILSIDNIFGPQHSLSAIFSTYSIYFVYNIFYVQYFCLLSGV